MLLRQMLGHGGYGDEYKYELQTIIDNVSLLSGELLKEINSIVDTPSQKKVWRRIARSV